MERKPQAPREIFNELLIILVLVFIRMVIEVQDGEGNGRSGETVKKVTKKNGVPPSRDCDGPFTKPGRIAVSGQEIVPEEKFPGL